MNLPPNPAGHGGSQRAWHLLQALRPHGDLHFVLLHSPQHQDCVQASLAPLEPFAASVTRIAVPEWRVSNTRALGILHPWMVDLARSGSHAAPRLPRRALEAIAAALPLREPDWLFAGRLGPAAILNDILQAGLIAAPLRLVDFDDVLSRFRARQIALEGSFMGRQWRAAARIDAALLGRAEHRIARAWHGISVSSAADEAALRLQAPQIPIGRIPNVIDRPQLSPSATGAQFRVLFVGNLAFPPNRHGLLQFLREAWPELRRELPQARLDIVGLDPPADIAAFAGTAEIALHANVPDVQPFYQAADAVIAPIFFGTGTRVKILEAAAFCRPIVSTALGAEGLDMVPGQHFLCAETMHEFAGKLRQLAHDPALGLRLAAAAQLHQQQHFSPQAASTALTNWLAQCHLAAAPQAARSKFQWRNSAPIRRPPRNTSREAA